MPKPIIIIGVPVGIVVCVLTLVFGYGYATNYTVIWKDFATVQNLHNVPDWTNIGAQYFQNMTLQTEHHGSVHLYTGPGGNMCTDFFPGSCGAGSVSWNNGTVVFVKQFNGGGLDVGAINR